MSYLRWLTCLILLHAAKLLYPGYVYIHIIQQQRGMVWWAAALEVCLVSYSRAYYFCRVFAHTTTAPCYSRPTAHTAAVQQYLSHSHDRCSIFFHESTCSHCCCCCYCCCCCLHIKPFFLPNDISSTPHCPC